MDYIYEQLDNETPQERTDAEYEGTMDVDSWLPRSEELNFHS